MAERSTAAVGVADNSGEDETLTAAADEAGVDSATDGHSGTSRSPEEKRTDAEATGGHQETSPDDPADARDATDAEAATDAGAAKAAKGTEAPVSAGPVGNAADPEDATGAPQAGAADAERPAQESGSAAEGGRKAGDGAPAESSTPPAPPELHSGHKIARRYRLEECVTRLDGYSSWRAVDEKLRRAVGVHVLPSGHPRARKVLSAARSSALLGDPRFVQVLDAVEDRDLVYVVREWLPDSVPLSEVLASGPMEPHEVYQLAGQLSQAMAAAHREGLAHLRLNPGTVLRTGSGQYRIRGLAVSAALRGISSDTPQRTDTEGIGAVLYAALTQRWPYEEDAYGLTGVGSLTKDALLSPEQVRAGVHRGLSQLVMRALVNDGATASSAERPCATPEDLAKAVAALPRIRPPEPAFTAPRQYPRPAYQQGAQRPGGPVRAGAAPGRPGAEPPAPPALPGRTGKALKWGVSALLIAALGLGSWQLADTMLKGDTSADDTGQVSGPDGRTETGKPVKIVDAKDFDPPPGGNGSENPGDVPDAYDGSQQTYWLTQKYIGRPDFGNLKPGVGLILDLGKLQQVSSVKVDFVGTTSAGFYAAPKSASGMPSSLGGFNKVTDGSGEHLTLKAKKPIRTQYVLVWLTKLPLSEDGNYRGRITEIQVQS